MPRCTFHINDSTVNIHCNGELTYRLPYSYDRIKRQHTAHLVQKLLGDKSYSFLSGGRNVVVAIIPDKKLRVLIPEWCYVASPRRSLWRRILDFFNSKKGNTMHALPTIHAREARAAEGNEGQAILKQYENKPDSLKAAAEEAIAKAAEEAIAKAADTTGE